MQQQQSVGCAVADKGCIVLAYLARGHVRDRPVGLDRLQLVQAPVQLLQRLDRQPHVQVVLNTHTHTLYNLMFPLTSNEQ